MRADPRDRDNIPCRDGGEMHRQVPGRTECGDCRTIIISHGFFIRSTALARRA